MLLKEQFISAVEELQKELTNTIDVIDDRQFSVLSELSDGSAWLLKYLEAEYKANGLIEKFLKDRKLEIKTDFGIYYVSNTEDLYHYLMVIGEADIDLIYALTDMINSYTNLLEGMSPMDAYFYVAKHLNALDTDGNIKIATEYVKHVLH